MTAPTTMRPPGSDGRPDHDGYDDARAVWNGAVDRRPRLIARCSGTADVAAAVRFARDRDLEIAVRGGGHNVAGTAVCDDGIVIDLSAMRAVTVDPVGRTARVQGGALWGTSTTRHRDTVWPPRAASWATPASAASAWAGASAGSCASMGSPSTTLWKLRWSPPRATSSGHRPTITPTCSGAAGRRRELRRRQLVPVQAASGRPYGHGRTGVLGGRGHHRRAAPTVTSPPTRLTSSATSFRLGMIPPLPVVSEELHFRPAIAVASCYAGPVEDGERAVRALRQFGTPLVDLVGPTLYVDHQSGLDDTVPHGWHYYWKATNLTRLSDEVIDVVAEHAYDATSPRSYATIFHMGGAAVRAPRDATAYPSRDVEHNIVIDAAWLPEQDDAVGAAETAWARAFLDALESHRAGVYVNFLDADDDTSRVHEAYGDDTYWRLADAVPARPRERIPQQQEHPAPHAGAMSVPASTRVANTQRGL